MSHVEHHTVTLTVAGGAGAAGPALTPSAHKRLDAIHYVVGSTPYTNAPLLTVTDVVSGEVLINGVAIIAGSRVFRPRLPTHDTAGVANAADFSAVAVSGQLQFDLTGGGADGEFGTFHCIFGGSK